MPLYIYVCEKGHKTERRAGLEDEVVSCPNCGGQAKRLPCSGLPYLSGETVVKCCPQATKAGDIKNKHGKYRVSLWNESMAEDAHRRRKAEGESSPDTVSSVRMDISQ